MKKLKADDLNVGDTYLCQLSHVKILIIQKELKTSYAKGRYFNSINGEYVTIDIFDGQLKDIE